MKLRKISLTLFLTFGLVSVYAQRPSLGVAVRGDLTDQFSKERPGWSLGIVLSVPASKHLSIQTGLAWADIRNTYDFTRACFGPNVAIASDRYFAEIPVRLYAASRGRKISLFASAGAVAGIALFTTEEWYDDLEMSERVAKDNQTPPNYSYLGLSFSAGLQLRLTDELFLRIEPSLMNGYYRTRTIGSPRLLSLGVSLHKKF